MPAALNLGDAPTTDPEVLGSLALNALQDRLSRLTAILFSGLALLDELEPSSELEHLSQLIETAGELSDGVSSGLGSPWTSAVLDSQQEHLARSAALLRAGRALLDQLESSLELEHFSQLVEMAEELTDEVSSGLDELLACDVLKSVTPADASPRQESPGGTPGQKFVREYLEGLIWDLVPRIDRWLVDYAGAVDTEAVRRVSRQALIDAVRRAKHPGCTLDRVLVIEGPQGSGKSEALRILAVEASWHTHTDGLPDSLRDMPMDKWIVEVPLTEHSAGDAERFKAFLSRQVDGACLVNQSTPARVPPQFVIIGSTNEMDGYLRDATGNRRFWPVRIQRFDLERLRADRDQLWAEAVAAAEEPRARAEVTEASSKFSVTSDEGPSPKWRGWSKRCRAADAQELFDGLLPRALARVTVLHLLPTASYHFRVIGDKSGPGGEWLIDCTVVPPTCVRVNGEPPVMHSVEITHGNLGVLLDKPDSDLALYFQGKLRLCGDPTSMFRFRQLFDLVAALEAPEDSHA